MLKRHLLPLLILIGLLPAVVGCSKNDNDLLHPADSSGIFLDVLCDGVPLPNNTLTVGSNITERTIEVNTTSRWVVEITDCDGAWCQVTYPDDEATQNKQGTFTVDAASNRSSVERTCVVTVYCVDADGTHVPGYSYSFTLYQERQYITVDAFISPVSAAGTSQQTEAVFEITANQDWVASTTADWLVIVPGEGMTGDGFTTTSTEEVTCTFRVRAGVNLSSAERTAEVIISSPANVFVPDRKVIRQEGSTDTFVVSPTGALPVSPGEGETVQIHVFSPADAWRITTVGGEGWVSVSPSSGQATSAPVPVTVTIAPNTSWSQRYATLVVTHGANIGGPEIAITQAGGGSLGSYDPVPVLSGTYVESGWTDAAARICAWFLSPYAEVTGGGVEIWPESSPGDVRDIPGTVDRETGQVVTDATGLTEMTSYTARSYVGYRLDGTDGRAYATPVTFTTAKPTIPKPDENTPPNP